MKEKRFNKYTRWALNKFKRINNTVFISDEKLDEIKNVFKKRYPDFRGWYKHPMMVKDKQMKSRLMYFSYRFEDDNGNFLKSHKATRLVFRASLDDIMGNTFFQIHVNL